MESGRKYRHLLTRMLGRVLKILASQFAAAGSGIFDRAPTLAD
jgi:hypothetical protein